MQPAPARKDFLFNLWYFIVVVAYIVVGAFSDIRKYFIWLKPLPVLLLILQLHLYRNTYRSVKFIQAGLFFGMIGDIFLEISGSKYYFHIGVAAFFIGHVWYIMGFTSSVKLLQTQTSTRSSIFFALIYGLIIAGGMMTNLHYLWKNIQDFEKIGFSMYSCALSFMSITAFYFAVKGRYDYNLKIVSLTIYLGSLMFMISDVSLSERERNDSIDSNTKKLLDYVVGVFYWLGQFLIGQGGLRMGRYLMEQQTQVKESAQTIKETMVTSQTISEPLL